MPVPSLGVVDIIDIIAEHGGYGGNMFCLMISGTQCQAMLVAPHHLLLWRFGARLQWFTRFSWKI